jgi:thioredoxin 1
MPVIEIKDVKQFDELLKQNERVILDFTAKWCGPCQKMAPVFAKLSDEVKNIVFASIDVDKNEEVHERYPAAIEIPCFICIHKGLTLDHLTCGPNPAKLVSNTIVLAKM